MEHSKQSAGGGMNPEFWHELRYAVPYSIVVYAIAYYTGFRRGKLEGRALCEWAADKLESAIPLPVDDRYVVQVSRQALKILCDMIRRGPK